jgi:hypothetical protein
MVRATVLTELPLAAVVIFACVAPVLVSATAVTPL